MKQKNNVEHDKKMEDAAAFKVGIVMNGIVAIIWLLTSIF
jgi:hypothetical protein